MENNNIQKVVHGFKVFRPDWSCNPDGGFKQYTCPGKFEEDGKLDICDHGMHFCENLADCFNYYPFNSDNKVAEIIAYGDVIKGDDKSCTNKLEIVREITWDEVLRLVNTGKNCTGRCNTGDRNTGNCNTGNRNTGNCNTGNCNTGNCNTGNRNTGDRNTGDCNTGDWNKSSFNTGCFNTEDLDNLTMFNKPSGWSRNDWLYSEARRLLNQIPKNVVEWIYSSDMTDEEKAEHPTHETTGGYLKVLDESECGQLWWDALPERHRDIIRALPNFDVAIFEEVTGIKVSE